MALTSVAPDVRFLSTLVGRGENEKERLEVDWDVYRRLAPAAVPRRAEQIATLLSLFPFGVDERFEAIELGCGEGYLSASLLACYPRATVLALDGSDQMLERARARLAVFGDRAAVRSFDLESDEWLEHVDEGDVVVSSLCLHHLNDAGKRTLFSELSRRLSRRGALLIADLVQPPRPEARALFEAMWDRAAEEQSIATTGSRSLYDLFIQSEWNLYRHPDPIDMPSPLFAQLQWLQEAGFSGVDCWWLTAGHAIYGGYLGPPAGEIRRLRCEDALVVARRTLEFG
jgi:tRNA (cmo5U34)-methyltransferase